MTFRLLKKIHLSHLYLYLNYGLIDLSFTITKQNKGIQCPRKARKILLSLPIVT